jgi:H+/Cl- antiporter ClcA
MTEYLKKLFVQFYESVRLPFAWRPIIAGLLCSLSMIVFNVPQSLSFGFQMSNKLLQNGGTYSLTLLLPFLVVSVTLLLLLSSF